jgi:hypothetical protein
MRELNIDADSMPKIIDELTREDSIPLEIGHCTMAKSVAILLSHGWIARLPYGMRNIKPAVFFFGVEPQAFQALRYFMWVA